MARASITDFWKPWFWAGPYVPSGILYGIGPSACVWLLPGYERWIDETGAIDVYTGPWWRRKNG